MLHYGLLWEVKGHNYAFDKAWYKNFDPQQCGPWDMSAERPAAGLFPLPPSPSTFTEVTVSFICGHEHLRCSQQVLLSQHQNMVIVTCVMLQGLPGQR